MASFNSFIQAVLTERHLNEKPGGDTCYMLSGSLYSESQRARYNFYNNELTLVETYGDTTSPKNIGVLNVGDSFIMPFNVYNVYMENDYAYIDTEHRINILTGKITKVNNPQMAYNLPFAADIEERALMLVPDYIENFHFVSISYCAETKNITFVAIRLRDTKVEDYNAQRSRKFKCGLKKGDLNLISDVDKFDAHTALITENDIYFIEYEGYYGAAIRYEYNAALFMEISSDNEEQIIITSRNGALECVTSDAIFNSIYGGYMFCFTDAITHQEATNLIENDTIYEFNYDKENLLIQTNDRRFIFKNNLLPCPITGRVDQHADSLTAEIKTCPESRMFKYCSFTPDLILRREYTICDETQQTDFNDTGNLYCSDYQILYTYSLDGNNIKLNVFEKFTDKYAAGIEYDQSFMFDLPDIGGRPTVRIEKEHLFIANALKINILTGERVELPNKKNIVLKPAGFNYMDLQSDRYLINHNDIDHPDIKDLQTGAIHQINGFNVYLDVAGNYLIAKYLNTTKNYKQTSSVNILISTPHFTIFEFV